MYSKIRQKKDQPIAAGWLHRLRRRWRPADSSGRRPGAAPSGDQSDRGAQDPAVHRPLGCTGREKTMGKHEKNVEVY